MEHFFRHESATLIAVLTRAFGIRRLALVEEAVQTAMLEAMHAWKHRGIPDEPSAWFHRVARNRLLDTLRREKTHAAALAHAGHSSRGEEMLEEWLEHERIPDSLLRMMFVCCHPALDRKTQIAITLKTLCGFGLGEISRGLMLPVETVKKRIQRGRKRLAEHNVALELPTDDEVAQRLNAVHDVLYLLFNEGYSTSHGSEPIRDDICEEAARLCHLLCETEVGSTTTRALMALMLFHAARLESRIDASGAAVLLEDQDRTRWNQNLIVVGKGWLARSRTAQPTRFHLEAAIAMQHCQATDVDTTDWNSILELYDRLLRLADSPVFAMNRAIALAQAGDTKAALISLQDLSRHDEMKDYYLLDCAAGRIYELEGNKALAVESYNQAMKKRLAPHEASFLRKKLLRLQHLG